MPFISESKYAPKSFVYRHAHISTIIPGKFKKYPIPNYRRERLELEDGDFLDLDWLEKKDKKRLLIISHGLEGNSRRTYVNSCADYFHEKEFSVLAWNYRTCSGEANRLLKMYHNMIIDDLDIIVNHSLRIGYEEIYLIGYSMGGSISLNYLGRIKTDNRVKSAVVFSAPIDLLSSTKNLKTGFNKVYTKNFIRTLKPKIEEKAKQFPDIPNADKIHLIKSFDEVDDYFTAPIHGYKDKEDYYINASPKKIIDKIDKPVLVVNALNDPFLSEECYPKEFAEQSEIFYLETPKYGGHCGFPLEKEFHSWAEIRAYEFFKSQKFI